MRDIRAKFPASGTNGDARWINTAEHPADARDQNRVPRVHAQFAGTRADLATPHSDAIAEPGGSLSAMLLLPCRG
jgi:hypothetical protein